MKILRRIDHFISARPKEISAASFGLAAFLTISPSPFPGVFQGIIIGVSVAAGVHSALEAFEKARLEITLRYPEQPPLAPSRGRLPPMDIS